MDQQGRFSATDQHEYRGAWSITDVLGDIETRIKEIVRSEIAVASMEFAEAAKRARPAARMLALGAVLMAFAVGFFLLTAMFAVAIVLPLWLAGLVTALASLIIALSALSVGRKRLKETVRKTHFSGLPTSR